LELDPENPYTHSNTGWAVLRRGDHKQALEHFREALRRDPMNDHAKAGLVEALKARYWLYRKFLGYMFWVSNMKPGLRWTLILGIYFGQQLLGLLTDTPGLNYVVWPVLICLILFTLSTWIMVPLSNLLLRLNKFGRYALDREETITSYFTGAALLTCIGAGIGFLMTGTVGLITLCMWGLVMMIPLASMLGGKKKYKMFLVLAACAVAGIGLTAVVITFKTGKVMNPLMTTFLYANLGYQFLSNALRE
jgi:hypothetical protein